MFARKATLIGGVFCSLAALCAEQAVQSQQPGATHPHEPLESYPLDALHFDGTLDSGGKSYGLVRAPDGLEHRVQIGSYVGEHGGRITAVAREGVSIVEPADEAHGLAERRIELGFAAPADAESASADTLAADCEKQARAQAAVTEVTDRKPTRTGNIPGYRLEFRGQSGATVVAQCWRVLDKITVAYSESGPASRPAWGDEGRPKDIPVGASSCDTEAQVKLFIQQLRSPDAPRLVPQRASRDKDVLVLRLENGAQVQLKDELRGCEEGTPDCTRYRFFQWRERAHEYVVYVIGAESTSFLAVDSRDGAKLSLPGYPVWSPSGRWVAAEAGESGAYDNLSLLVQGMRAPDREPGYSQQYGSSYCVVGWSGENSLSLRVMQKGRPGELRKPATRHLTFDGKAWLFKDP